MTEQEVMNWITAEYNRGAKTTYVDYTDWEALEYIAQNTVFPSTSMGNRVVVGSTSVYVRRGWRLQWAKNKFIEVMIKDTRLIILQINIAT